MQIHNSPPRITVRYECRFLNGLFGFQEHSGMMRARCFPAFCLFLSTTFHIFPPFPSRPLQLKSAKQERIVSLRDLENLKKSSLKGLWNSLEILSSLNRVCYCVHKCKSTRNCIETSFCFRHCTEHLVCANHR